MKQSILKDKSYLFAIDIVRLTQDLRSEFKEFTLTNQILKSGTSIGANISEAEFGQSKADFIHKMSISLKEANETDYWLRLLKDTHYIDDERFELLHDRVIELIRMLVSSIKTSRTL